jgi:hypothetical protein
MMDDLKPGEFECCSCGGTHRVTGLLLEAGMSCSLDSDNFTRGIRAAAALADEIEREREAANPWVELVEGYRIRKDGTQPQWDASGRWDTGPADANCVVGYRAALKAHGLEG